MGNMHVEVCGHSCAESVNKSQFAAFIVCEKKFVVALLHFSGVRGSQTANSRFTLKPATLIYVGDRMRRMKISFTSRQDFLQK